MTLVTEYTDITGVQLPDVGAQIMFSATDFSRAPLSLVLWATHFLTVPLRDISADQWYM